MPYIDLSQREKYKYLVDVINNYHDIETKGDLEYLVFVLMKKFMSIREKRYSTLHEVVYAVIHAGEEYKRRYLDKRENEARKINGDII